MSNDLPPWAAVYQQTQRWLQAGCFEALVHDLRAVLRMASERPPEPTAAIIDSRTLRSTPESGPRAGYDGAKRKRGSKLHMAVNTLGHLLALHVTPANHDDRAEVGRLAGAIQQATDQSVELAYVDQGYTGERSATAAKNEGSRSRWSSCPKAKRGFVLLPRRLVVERSFAWARDAAASSKTTSLCCNSRRSARRRIRMPHDEAGRTAHRTSITPSSRIQLAAVRGRDAAQPGAAAEVPSGRDKQDSGCLRAA